MARMARTQPSGVDLHARPGRIPRKAPSVAGFFWGGKQAATVRGGTAVAGFFGGIVVGHCGLTKWGTAQKFDV